ncbi:glycoside hydrolase family 2 protein [Agromyces sp. SYSU T00194]|uniref:glycoside hydrolase family 2 protein n=1 Tax=Agromyces chitinivorans TaxID=3158560 RepID=UPI00339A1EC6
MRTRRLDDGWTLRASGGPVPGYLEGRVVDATVPGVVHTDLLRHGLVPDVRDGDNEVGLAWIGRSSWTYELDFEWRRDDHRRHDLVFDGLDTIARVSLNGRLLARTANQHRSYRLDVADALVQGTNTLAVEFLPALDHARAEARRLGPLPMLYPHPFAFIRKAACNFGWDWGPEAITAGIWREVRLESWSDVRIAAVRAHAGASGRALVRVDLEHERPGEASHVECTIAGWGSVVDAVAEIGRSGELELRVPSPELWWPRGMGEQPRYDLEVRTGGDIRRQRIGFRTIAIDSTPDAEGVPFSVVVNGEPMTTRGVNWIPESLFPSETTSERYRRRLGDAIDLNANTVRVWGGGVYESDAFYDRCDAEGLLVWQDFMFSCAAYPEEEPLRSEVASEIADAVDRLASHPSLAVWNGSNENLWGVTEWGWASELGDRTWGREYYDTMIPGTLARMDPERVYIPSSPFSRISADQNDPRDALTHAWDVWNRDDYTAYAKLPARFVSEFGLQSAASASTLRSAIADGSLDHPRTGQLRRRQKGIDGVRKLEASYAAHLPEPRGFDDWVWTTQLNQARGLRFGMDHFQGREPRSTGLIVWQLNDVWPAVSWSLVDAAGVRKPAWFSVRDAFADRTGILTDAELVVSNDTDSTWESEWSLRRVSATGTLQARDRILVVVPPRSTRRHALPSAFRTDPTGDGLVIATADELRRVRPDVEPNRLPLAAPSFEVGVAELDDGIAIVVLARSVLLDLCCLADRFDPGARVDSGMVTLLPGESHTFLVTTCARPTADDVVASSALRSTSDLVGTIDRAAN